MPMAGLVYLVVLGLMFRCVSGVLPPLAAVGVGVTWTLATFAAMHESMNVVSNILPVLLVIIAAVLWGRSGAPSSSTTDAPNTSIAVLPFENLSTDKDNAFFAVGIQDEILTRLAKIGALKVISRTSTARLSSRPENLPEIARELGVANVLEGSVQRSGDKVRVNVQLIRAATDEHLWAEIYDRKMEDIFTVQSEISTAIAAALSAKVSGGEKQVLAEIPTTNTAAYDAYLRGLAFKREENSRKASDAFREAVRLDPKFAQGWVELSMMTANDAFVFADRKLAAESRNALATAERLQPGMPELQLAEGYVLYYIEQDFEGARQQFAKVHAERPNDVECLYELGLITRRLGRWEESRTWLEQAITLDPLRADMRISLQQLLTSMRDYAGATRVINDAMNRWPDNTQVIIGKLDTLISEGKVDEAAALLRPLKPLLEDGMQGQIHDVAAMRRKYDDAIPMLQSLLDQKPEGPVAGGLHSALGHLYALSGDAGKAKDHLDRAKAILLATLASDPGNKFVMQNLAFIYAYAGERDLALKYTEMVVRLTPSSKDAYAGPVYEDNRARIWAMFGDRDRAIPELARLLKTTYAGPLTPAWLRLDPTFDKLRGDPRFEALLK